MDYHEDGDEAPTSNPQPPGGRGGNVKKAHKLSFSSSSSTSFEGVDVVLPRPGFDDPSGSPAPSPRSTSVRNAAAKSRRPAKSGGEKRDFRKDIIDGFAISSFKTLDALQVCSMDLYISPIL